eukprot:Clim_evm26s253 gene=Clim_evmTU26s253
MATTAAPCPPSYQPTAHPSNATATVPGDEEAKACSNYRFLKCVGEGNFAKVWMARHEITDEEVAVKVVEKAKLSATNAKYLAREVAVMKLVKHPNIVRLYEVIETKSKLILVMEYCPKGEIFDYVVAQGRLQEREARRVFRQLLSAIAYCHSRNIIHRDLKAENLLLDGNMHIKVADFGFGRTVEEGDNVQTSCGSPPYAAPEIFAGSRYDGPEVDVWACGIMLYVLVTGCLPFDGANLSILKQRVTVGKFRIPLFMSVECERLIKRCLTVDRKKRPTIFDLLSDPWINMGYEDCPLQITGLEAHSKDAPLDRSVLELMESMGVVRASVEQSLEENAYNNLTSAYHLLKDRILAKGSVAAVQMELMDKNVIAGNNNNAAVQKAKKEQRLKSAQIRVTQDLETETDIRRISFNGPRKPSTLSEDVANMHVSHPPASAQQQQGQAQTTTGSGGLKQRIMAQKLDRLRNLAPFSRRKSSTVEPDPPASPMSSGTASKSPLGHELRASMGSRQSLLVPGSPVQEHAASRSSLSPMLGRKANATERTKFAAASVTSKKSEVDVRAQVVKALNKHNMTFDLASDGKSYSCRVEKCDFDIKIITLNALSLVMVQFKRTRGEAFVYKQVVENLVGSLRL